jgi:hypothetical protein
MLYKLSKKMHRMMINFASTIGESYRALSVCGPVSPQYLHNYGADVHFDCAELLSQHIIKRYVI